VFCHQCVLWHEFVNNMCRSIRDLSASAFPAGSTCVSYEYVSYLKNARDDATSLAQFWNELPQLSSTMCVCLYVP